METERYRSASAWTAALVVEDEGITQLQLGKILKRAGFTVVGAALNGQEGVELALREHPELVLMDVNMPGPYNGLEAARRILAEFRTCVVMLTAYVDYADEAQKLGACGYIVKPLDEQSLLPQLRNALQRFSRARTSGRTTWAPAWPRSFARVASADSCRSR